MSERARRGFDIAATSAFAVALMLLAAVLIFSRGTATANQIATLHLFGGQVAVGHSEGPLEPGREGESLRAGDTIRTGSDGRAFVEYFDGSITRLDVDSSLRIVSLRTIADGDGSRVIDVQQANGNSFHRVVDVTDPASRFQVETPTATASVRGTVYAIMVGTDGSTSIAVFRGSVIARGASDAVRVGPGMMVMVGVDGSVGTIEEISDEVLDSDWITFNQCELDRVRVCAADVPAGAGASGTVSPSAGGTASEADGAGDGAGGGGTIDGPPPSIVDPPPIVRITRAPDTLTTSHKASFTFTSSEAGSGFICTLDGQRSRCGDTRGPSLIRGSVTYSKLALGDHSFSVSVTDASSNTGSDAYEWTIVAAGEEPPVFDHIRIAPSRATIRSGASQRYTAEAFDTNGRSMGDVTRRTSFSIAPDGSCSRNSCTATQPGDHIVTGTYSGDSDIATLIVEGPPPPACPHYELAFHTRPPDEVKQGHQFNVQVRVAVLDGGDRDGPLTIELILGGGSFSGGETSKTWRGQGTIAFNHLEIDQAGSYTVTARAPCAAPTDAARITVTETPRGSAMPAANRLGLVPVTLLRRRGRHRSSPIPHESPEHGHEDAQPREGRQG